MSLVTLILPHQLFDPHPAIERGRTVLLVEHPLLFRQYCFHRSKLVLHRASMEVFAETLRDRGLQVQTIAQHAYDTDAAFAHRLLAMGITHVVMVDPNDDWLERRMVGVLRQSGLTVELLPDPHFLTAEVECAGYFAAKPKFLFADFYAQQRRRLGILVTDDGKPIGGQWSFDSANRKKLPKTHEPPATERLGAEATAELARASIAQEFPRAWGDDQALPLPVSHAAAGRWLTAFIEQRLPLFGDYEDAISHRHDRLYHSVLTPLLNIGLLSPGQVVKAVLAAQTHAPLNSVEGFIRQVIGWREFVRGVYRSHGRYQRCSNFFGHTRAMPQAFYTATTGLAPVDHVITKVMRTGYCHHIERLMVLGTMFLLCEISPDAVYQWFMELFVDAYDWVMVPNVYGMSQYADGGLMTTKPYLCGSSYIRKMSDFAAGPWCDVWDGLYWRFIARHRKVFAKNPRWSMMVSQLDRLGASRDPQRRAAETFLERLQ